MEPGSSIEGLVLVTRVIDGDTVEIKGGKRVRYLGIDTPETVDPRRPVECFGHEASEKNKELV
ncbi:MAG: thermonuclease family protein, partial [Candidatus Colwellbacteria bacterium]|nr:thermonuclease family protein [Candidatus Colwellbacteria bacterium]